MARPGWTSVEPSPCLATRRNSLRVKCSSAANTEIGTLVLKDQAGDYILLSEATLEECRVPEEHKAQIEQLISGQHDVQGYLWHALFTPLAVLTVGGVLIYKRDHQRH